MEKYSSADCDDDEGGIVNANPQHHGTPVGLGIVRSVYIDLSPESGRQLIYDVEVLTKRKKDTCMPVSSPANSTTTSTSCTSAPSGRTTDVPLPPTDAVKKIELPEWSLRYAPNCPAQFDLTCLINEDDDLPALEQSSTIPNEVGTTSSAAKGIILCGLPTPCEDGEGIVFVYSALIHRDDGDQFYEVHDIPLHFIRFDPTSMHYHQATSSSTVKSSSSTSDNPSPSKAKSSAGGIATIGDDASSPTTENEKIHNATSLEDGNTNNTKESIDAGTDQDMKHKKLTTHDTSNDSNTDVKPTEDSSSPTSTLRRSSKSSRRDHDGIPSPSKKSRSSREDRGRGDRRGERSSDRKERRKKDRRERSSSPHRSSRRDRRSRSRNRSRSRDRVSRSSRSRKHSYSSRSWSRSRSLDQERGRERGRERGHRSFSRSRSRERPERPQSLRDRSMDGCSDRRRSYDGRETSHEASKTQENHRNETATKHSESASNLVRDKALQTWIPPSQSDRSRQVAIPRWMNIDNVVRAVSKNQHRFQEGFQGFVASAANFRVKFSLDAVTVDPDLSQANLPHALNTIKEKLCELVKDDGAYHRLLYELAVFDIEKTGPYDGGPVCVVDPLPQGASRHIDRIRRWRMIMAIPYCQRDSSFHGMLFLLGANGSRVLELEKQYGCRITVFGRQGGRYPSHLCRPYVSILSKQEYNVAHAAEQIRVIFREHQNSCDCIPRM